MAKYDLILVSDADVRVPPDFLVNMVAPLREPEVALVNCFYRLANPATRAMQWEAIAINADFWSQVLQSQMLKPLDFALGATMLQRRKSLGSRPADSRPLPIAWPTIIKLEIESQKAEAALRSAQSWWIAGTRRWTGAAPGNISCAGHGQSASASRFLIFSAFCPTELSGRCSCWLSRSFRQRPFARRWLPYFF